MASQTTNEAPKGDAIEIQTEYRVASQNQGPQQQLEVIRRELGQTTSERESLRTRLAIVREDLNKSTAETEIHQTQLAALMVNPSDTITTWEDQQQIKDLPQERDASFFRIIELEARIPRLESGSEPDPEGDWPIAATSQHEADDLYYQIHGVGGYREQVEHLQSQLEAYEPNGEGEQLDELRKELEEMTSERNLLLIQLYSDERIPQSPNFQAQIQSVQPVQQQGDQDHSEPNLLRKYQEEIGQLHSSRGELLDQFIDLQRQFLDEQKQSVDLQEQTKLEMMAYSDSIQLCTDERNKLQEDIHQFATAITEMEAELNRQAEKHANKIGERDSAIAALQLESMTGPNRFAREHAHEIMEKDTIIATLQSELGTEREGRSQDEIRKRDEALATLESELNSERIRLMDQIEDQEVDIKKQIGLIKQQVDISKDVSERLLVTTDDHQNALEEVEMIRETCEKLMTLNQQLDVQLRDKNGEIVGLRSALQVKFSNNPPGTTLQESDKERGQFEQQEKHVRELESESELGEVAAQQLQELKGLYQDVLDEQEEQLEQHEAVVRALRCERDQHKATAAQRNELKGQHEAIVRELESTESQLAATREEFNQYKERKPQIISELQQRLATSRAEQHDLRDQIVALGGRIEGHLLIFGKPSGDKSTATKNFHLQNGAAPMEGNQNGVYREGTSQTEDLGDVQHLGSNPRNLEALRHQIEYLRRTNILLLHEIGALGWVAVKTATTPVILGNNCAHLTSQLQNLKHVLQHEVTESTRLDQGQLADVLHHAIEQLINQLRILSELVQPPRLETPSQPSLDANNIDTDENISPSQPHINTPERFPTNREPLGAAETDIEMLGTANRRLSKIDSEMPDGLSDEPNREQQVGQNAQHEQLPFENIEQPPTNSRATRSSTRSTRNREPVYTWPPTRVRGSRVGKKKAPKKKG
ncbi:uncharacterized protein BP5553_08272 [Venustampulla echinocandica]|uniref:Uncharacterized protein n=1 Tax=Venustampulla echinocandica TaxID=2656787 RepID=A0A370TG67_9HELO|nr:uncharacterized protein BP5553_08272 [Venustampulla echinocandica]RDL33904.1 hypothetical protein BP5553_08272 [Venustampulla echinocandica]